MDYQEFINSKKHSIGNSGFGAKWFPEGEFAHHSSA